MKIIRSGFELKILLLLDKKNPLITRKNPPFGDFFEIFFDIPLYKLGAKFIIHPFKKCHRKQNLIGIQNLSFGD